MSANAKNTRTTIVPCLRYRDAKRAIDWLCEVFGFEKMAVYANEDGSIAHAQLSFGNGMIMLGSVGSGSEWGRLIRQPDELGGMETQAAYVVVENVDLVYQKARAANADMMLDIKDEDYGGKSFTCRNLEGHLWTFGDYDPWQ